MTIKFRSIWISDTHLGGKNIKSRQLYQFLQQTDSDYLYLVGDILDLLQLARKWHWPSINNRIVDLILQKAQNGTKVIYMPGNHDGALRNYIGSRFNGIEILEETVHIASDGRKYLVLHGDKFDCIIQKSPWLARLGGFLYEGLLCFNRYYNSIRRFFGKDYFSISAYLKHKCKKAVNYIGDFEETLLSKINRHKVDGIVCGHIHNASIKLMGESLYCNAGDWVESCTALAENHNGTIGIINWPVTNPLPETLSHKEYEKDCNSDGCLAPTN